LRLNTFVSSGTTALLLAGLLGSAADAQPRFGALTGIVRDGAKTPLVDATVTATQLDGSTVRGTISGTGGRYAFSDLPPGTYAVVTQLLGYSDVTVASLHVAAGLASRADVVMNAPVVAPATLTALSVPAAPPAPTPGSATAPAAATAANGAVTRTQAAGVGQDNFWRHLIRDEHRTPPRTLTASLKGTTANSPEKPAIGVLSPDRSSVSDSEHAAPQPYQSPAPQKRSTRRRSGSAGDSSRSGHENTVCRPRLDLAERHQPPARHSA
jgi:hypothetical protein